MVHSVSFLNSCFIYDKVCIHMETRDKIRLVALDSLLSLSAVPGSVTKDRNVLICGVHCSLVFKLAKWLFLHFKYYSWRSILAELLFQCLYDGRKARGSRQQDSTFPKLCCGQAPFEWAHLLVGSSVLCKLLLVGNSASCNKCVWSPGIYSG